MKTVLKQKEFENEALLIFLLLGIQFTLIRHEKRSSNRRNLKTKLY